MPLPAWLGTILDPLAKIFDSVHYSGEEKAQAKIELIKIQADIAERVAAYELKLIEAQQSIIVAEAQGESWLQRNWRPLTMLVFVFVIAWNYVIAPLFSWVSATKFPLLEIPEGMWTLLQIGIGGYVGLRSAEKMVDTIANSSNISIGIGKGSKEG